jgi:type I restriction enzyme S subunit
MFFQTIEYRNAVSAAALGVNINNLRPSHIAELPLTLPPLAEHKRIVAKIEELTTRSRRANEALDTVPPLLDQLRQSILAAAFRGDLTADWRAKNPDVEPADKLLARIRAERRRRWETTLRSKGKEPRESEFADVAPVDVDGLPKLPDGWCWTTLGDIITSLDQGWSPKCESHPRVRPEEWAVMKTTAVQPNRFEPAENKRLPTSLTPRPETELREGDLLITRAGPRSRAGVSCRVGSVPPRLMACDKVYRFRVDESLVLGGYVELLLNSPWALGILEVMKTGSSDSGVNLTQDKFLGMVVPIAPIDEQAQLLCKTRAVVESCERLAGHHNGLVAHMEWLNASILAKAFRGELVPQDPTDEPASVLLDRIRAARSTETPTKPPRKPKPPAPPEPARVPTQPQLLLDPQTLQDELFTALWTLGPLDQATAIRKVAESLRAAGHVDFQRLRADGPLHTQILTALETAVETGQLDRPTLGHVRACKPDATAYTPDDWRDALVASLGPEPIDREQAIRNAAEWARDNLGLAFSRLRNDGHIAEGLRSAITSAIRRREIVGHAKRISRPQ